VESVAYEMEKDKSKKRTSHELELEQLFVVDRIDFKITHQNTDFYKKKLSSRRE